MGKKDPKTLSHHPFPFPILPVRREDGEGEEAK